MHVSQKIFGAIHVTVFDVKLFKEVQSYRGQIWHAASKNTNLTQQPASWSCDSRLRCSVAGTCIGAQFLLFWSIYGRHKVGLEGLAGVTKYDDSNLRRTCWLLNYWIFGNSSYFGMTWVPRCDKNQQYASAGQNRAEWRSVSNAQSSAWLHGLSFL